MNQIKFSVIPEAPLRATRLDRASRGRIWNPDAWIPDLPSLCFVESGMTQHI